MLIPMVAPNPGQRPLKVSYLGTSGSSADTSSYNLGFTAPIAPRRRIFVASVAAKGTSGGLQLVRLRINGTFGSNHSGSTTAPGGGSPLHGAFIGSCVQSAQGGITATVDFNQTCRLAIVSLWCLDDCANFTPHDVESLSHANSSNRAAPTINLTIPEGGFGFFAASASDDDHPNIDIGGTGARYRTNNYDGQGGAFVLAERNNLGGGAFASNYQSNAPEFGAMISACSWR